MKVFRYIELTVKGGFRRYLYLPQELQSPEKALPELARLNYGRAPYGHVYYFDSTCIIYSQPQQAPVEQALQEVKLSYDTNYKSCQEK